MVDETDFFIPIRIRVAIYSRRLVMTIMALSCTFKRKGPFILLFVCFQGFECMFLVACCHISLR